MKGIIAVIGQKGGTGKTTLSTNLAVAAELHGHSTLLLDLDPQTSASTWGDLRESDAPAIIPAPATRVNDLLEKAEGHGADFAIMDTPPNADGSILEVARAADLVLIPCKPSRTDLKAIEASVAIAEMAKTPAHFVVSMVDPRTNFDRQAREAMKNYDIPCAPCQICDRAAFIHATNHGFGVMEWEPKSKASREIQELYAYISSEIGLEV